MRTTRTMPTTTTTRTKDGTKYVPQTVKFFYYQSKNRLLYKTEKELKMRTKYVP